MDKMTVRAHYPVAPKTTKHSNLRIRGSRTKASVHKMTAMSVQPIWHASLGLSLQNLSRAVLTQIPAEGNYRATEAIQLVIR